METTNKERAELAYRALLKAEGGTSETGIIDLLTNLMHYCDESGYDFETALDFAHRHHEVETAVTKCRVCGKEMIGDVPPICETCDESNQD